MFPRTLKMTVIAPCVICVKALEKVNCFSSGGLGEKKCYYRPLCRKKKVWCHILEATKEYLCCVFHMDLKIANRARHYD